MVLLKHKMEYERMRRLGGWNMCIRRRDKDGKQLVVVFLREEKANWFFLCFGGPENCIRGRFKMPKAFFFFLARKFSTMARQWFLKHI